MTSIKEHEHACMASEDEILDLEINGTAKHILEQIGLSRVAKYICEKCKLKTFKDIGKLTSEKIKSIELKPVQRKILIKLVTNCCDENTYKKYRRENLHVEENFDSEDEQYERRQQKERERRKRIHEWRGPDPDEGYMDSDLSALQLTPQSRSNTRERARASLENLLAKLVS